MKGEADEHSVPAPGRHCFLLCSQGSSTTEAPDCVIYHIPNLGYIGVEQCLCLLSQYRSSCHFTVSSQNVSRGETRSPGGRKNEAVPSRDEHVRYLGFNSKEDYMNPNFIKLPTPPHPRDRTSSISFICLSYQKFRDGNQTQN